jgi:hypothetical protein
LLTHHKFEPKLNQLLQKQSAQHTCLGQNKRTLEKQCDNPGELSRAMVYDPLDGVFAKLIDPLSRQAN